MIVLQSFDKLLSKQFTAIKFVSVLLFVAIAVLFISAERAWSQDIRDEMKFAEINKQGTFLNSTVGETEKCVVLLGQCVDGVLLPLWEPTTNLNTRDRIARAVIYFASLMYSFLGVSIIADRFMAAIEVITSQERQITIKLKGGEKQVVSVRIWNETVSNLTLMALGSSAPEILLSIIEIAGKDFKAGDLGPGTIVGSAAFNLFIIIGICVLSVPNGECRRIKHLTVFFVTATWSIFAYLWLYLILAFITPDVIDIWEALLTFFFFPLTVITAYIADTKIFIKKFLPKKVKRGRFKSISIPENGEMELKDGLEDSLKVAIRDGYQDDNNLLSEDSAQEFEKHRMEYIAVIRDIRKRNPNIDTKQLEEMAQMEVLNRGPKSRAFYRMQATRTLTGSGNVIKKSKVERHSSLDADSSLDKQNLDPKLGPHVQRIYFEPGHYTVMENVGTFYVTVCRAGPCLDSTVSVNYSTEDGSATAQDDYIATSGTIVFYPGEVSKQIPVTIIDDDIFEEDEHFYMGLSNPRILDPASARGMHPSMELTLVNPLLATIMVLDDDHSGVFHFESKEFNVAESKGFLDLKLVRSSGARNTVRVPYHTIEGTAHGGGKDFEDAEGYITFEDDQTEAFIKIRIVDDNEYEKNEFFYVQLGEPYEITKSGHPKISKMRSHEGVDSGAPKLGEISRIEVHITESQEFKKTVDHLLKSGNLSLVVGTSSWKEQFVEAITVSAGDGGPSEDDQNFNDDIDEKLPSCLDYVMHFLTIFWKVLFAFVPPTDYCGGWLCFTVSIVVIGVLTAIIGDLASGFGCTVGLADSVTAVTFVALGTSLPDTFASKVAAVNDQYADSSIGNVTGSNAVNVFLGIGIAWSMAAIVHWYRGITFNVKAGGLGFSVTVFCVFALFAIALIMIRRYRGGELGGPKCFKYISATFMAGLWMAYIILSSLKDYCHLSGIV